MVEHRSLAARRAAGVFYTPPNVVRAIVERVMGGLAGGSDQGVSAVLDPACGDGAFLRGVLESLCTRYPAVSRATIAAKLYGVDTDREALAQAGRSLPAVADHLIWGNALVRARLPNQEEPPIDWELQFPDIFARGGFDAIVGNPPYLNIRRLARHTDPATKEYLQREYQCAFGCYDLYTLFIELAFRLLRPGGVCGMIVPNKIATLRYAQPCRALLAERTQLLDVVDVSDLKVFADASVYPYILVWRKERAAESHRVSIQRPQSLTELAKDRTCEMAQVAQSSLAAESGWRLQGSIDLESRVATRPLRACCRLASGATGFSAQRLADELHELAEPARGTSLDFIVSGNIDRFQIQTGQVRFMGRRFERPRLPVDSRALSPAKRALYQTPKIVVAGMSRRLEAAWDAKGLALGVQVYAATDFQLDADFLLGLLNSKLMSHLFRQRFQAKRLSGNYLSINLRQLAELPIATIPAVQQRGLARLVRSRMAASSVVRQAKYERQIDRTVYDLYRLGDAERSEIESAFQDGR